MPKNHTAPAIIDYYTDALCVWAWISQPRLEEVRRQWGDEVQVRHRYVDIFGDSHNKIRSKWGQPDGFDKFATHVADAAIPFDTITVHPDVWSKTRPHSSTQVHLLLKAVELLAGEEAVAVMAHRVRHAFFCQAQDIGDQSLLLRLADEQSLDTTRLQESLRNGSAMAALSSDQRDALELGVKGSPTWVLNQGRQMLYGNVGYRILNANIQELLKHPGTEASWC